MPDEASTPPDVPTPSSEPAPVSEPAPAPVEATPEPNTPTPPSPEATDGQSTPSEENTTPPQSSPQLRGGGAEGTEVSESVPEPTPEPQAPPEPATEPEEEHHHPASPTRHPSSTEEGRVKGDIAKARAAMQDRKRKKLDKIMAKLAEKNKITNDEVEKLLHISDATATRYLEALKKENKIKQTGKTGAAVFYEKI